MTAQEVKRKLTAILSADVKDIFALQDEITMKVITALQVELTAGEMGRFQRKVDKKMNYTIDYLILRGGAIIAFIEEGWWKSADMAP